MRQVFCFIRRVGLLLLFTLLINPIEAQKIRIKILAGTTLKEVKFRVVSGHYRLVGLAPTQNNMGALSKENGELTFKSDTLNLGHVNRLIQVDSSSQFEVYVHGSWKPYGGALEIRDANGQLQLINEIDIEDYLPGVVEAEVGKHNPLEFDKLQATISRTYALSNYKKHEQDSFNLCDQVHCQVYKGSATNALVQQAVQQTRNEVIVDDNLNLITAAFHSNCGGCTANSEEVWSLSSTYLKAVVDTFCIRMPNAKWVSTVHFSDFLSYVQSKITTCKIDSQMLAAALPFNTAQKRVSQFVAGSPQFALPTRQIRTDLHLKSAIFSIQLEGQAVVFYGKGYGHGVGMCQEGSLRMAQQGFSYKQIIAYYYQRVHLVNTQVLGYLHQE